MTTTQHKIAMLEQFGFTAGDRDPRLNTDHPGEFMVVEASRDDIADFELPTRDGSNGPWCIVGGDFDALVGEAHEYLMGMADDHNGIADQWQRISTLAEGDLPERRFTSLAEVAGPSHP